MNSSAVVDLTPFVDTVNGYDLVRVKFYWYAHSFENAEDYYVEYCADGLSCLTWEQLGQFERCCTELETSRQCNRQTKCDFNNGDSGFHKIDLPKPVPGSNPHLRIRMDASGTGDYLFIDNFELQVRGTGEHSPSASPSQSPTTDECNVNNGGCMPPRRQSEAWHFDCRGRHLLHAGSSESSSVYDATEWAGKSDMGELHIGGVSLLLSLV